MKHFIICASKDHVLAGIKKGIAQAGHGRKNLVNKLSKGDWIVYYSSKDKMGNNEPYQKFTAIGKVADDEPHQPTTKENLRPYRRNIEYSKCEEADIKPLLEKLSFIKNKKRWGFYLISGFREIPEHDFNVIKKAML